MKMLTVSHMAAARLRANKRSYLLLVIGIFLSVFLVTTLCIAIQGVILAIIRKTELKVGSQDAYLLDCPDITDDDLENMGYFDSIGHVYVTAMVENSGDYYLGYYDDTAADFLNRQLREGRMPENPGEIAIESSAILALWESDAPKLGDTVELPLVPVDGQPEKRNFTIVGILTDQSESLKSQNTIQVKFVNVFPAILTARDEAPFATGRTVVHRLMSMVVDASEELFQTFYDRTTGSFDQHFWVVTFLGEPVEFYYSISPIYYFISGSLSPLLWTAILILALLLACGVGIAGSMEGILQQRSTEIGILRALGATRRQIRRIFGRESWLLAATIAPIAIAAGCAFTWALSRFAPDTLIFRPEPMLLLPVVGFSAAVILLSKRRPLRRAAKQMPMGILRDVGLLRKAKGIHSVKNFRVPKLISRRYLRLYPSRMIGAMLLAFLMCFSAAMAGGVVSSGRDALSPEDAAYILFMVEQGIRSGFASYLSGPGLSQQSVSQICGLPYVHRVDVNYQLPVSILLDGKTSYPMGQSRSANLGTCHFEDYLREQEIYASLTDRPPVNQGELRAVYDKAVAQYDADRKKLGIEQEVVQSNLLVRPLDAETISQLEKHLVEGRIDADAINAGREVLAMMPTIYYMSGFGKFYGMTDDPKQAGDNPQIAGENDCIHAGMTLPLIQLYSNDMELFDEDVAMDYAVCQRYDEQVTVGGVLDCIPEGMDFVPGGLITTEQGLRNMSLAQYGWDDYSIYLTGMPEDTARQELSARIKAISRRTTSLYFIDRLENYEEDARTQTQTLLALGSICLVFFAVSTGMIVSTVTRQLQSDGKRIGMLRAVGANEGTIFRCYTGQVFVPLLFGAGMTLLTLALLSGVEFFSPPAAAYLLMLSFVAVFTAGCILVCLAMLRQRIRQITRLSIIENIREL